MKRILLLAALFGALPAFAQDLPHLDEDMGCLPAASADKYIRDFRIDIASFGGRELCDTGSDGKKILTDIWLIEGGRFRNTGRNVFINGFVPADNYYGWMKTQTRGMNRKNDIPFASAYNSGGYFTFQDGWAQSSTLGRVGTIIHEARHTAGYRHVPCTAGPYAGSSVAGCDTDLPSGGSHGVEMEYYARVVADGENFHPVYRSMARLMALGRSNAFFNANPMKRREALVALDRGKRNVIVLDGAKLWERPAPEAPGVTTLKRTSFGAVLFTSASAFGSAAAWSIDPYNSDHGAALIRDAYSYFKMLERSDTGYMQLRDLEEFDVGNRRYLVGLTANFGMPSYDFPGGQWNAAIPIDAVKPERFVTVVADGSTGLFVLGQDGRVHPYHLPTRRLAAPLAAEWPADVLSYVKLNGRLLTLRTNGTLEGEPLLADREISEAVSVPLYDAFDLR
jgi:hypothetical protein